MKGHMKKKSVNIEEVLKAKYESERESSVTVFIRVREKRLKNLITTQIWQKHCFPKEIKTKVSKDKLFLFPASKGIFFSRVINKI